MPKRREVPNPAPPLGTPSASDTAEATPCKFRRLSFASRVAADHFGDSLILTDLVTGEHHELKDVRRHELVFDRDTGDGCVVVNDANGGEKVVMLEDAFEKTVVEDDEKNVYWRYANRPQDCFVRQRGEFSCM